jgi:Domain of unknown function (DUF5665)
MSKQKMSAAEAKQAANALEKLFASGMVSRKHVYKENFIRGFFFSAGSVLGATIGVGLIVWALSLFNTLPFIGRFTHNIQQTVNDHK